MIERENRPISIEWLVSLDFNDMTEWLEELFGNELRPTRDIAGDD
jgi:hypothetical protein